MNRLVSATSLALVAAILAACSSSSTAANEGGRDRGSGPSTTAAEGTRPPTPTASAVRLLHKAQLRAAIVGIDTLPTGYSVDRDQSNGNSTTFCDYKVPQPEKVKVSTDFIKGGGLSVQLIIITLRQYASPAAAKESFAALATALKTCRGERYEGEKLHYSLMSAPKLADASLGVRIDYDSGTNLSYFVLDGPVVVNVGGGGLIDVNAEHLASVLKAQIVTYENAAIG